MNEGIFLSTDNGENWNSINDGLKNIPILSLLVHSSSLYAGTWGAGVWRRPLSELITLVDESNNSLPINYNLFQNYPNPFNPNTKIIWLSPVGSWQTIKVFDVLGNEVATLVDEYKPAGTYEVEFNASQLSSGVYFYQLSIDDFIQTKKMVLMK